MIEEIVNWILFSLLALEKNYLTEALSFFIYDSIKILILLFAMISFIGFLRSYISSDKMRKWVARMGEGPGNLAASIFGAVTPFCSCSSIPIFMGFMKSGLPTGIAFSFLITSPIINEYLVVLMLGFFGWKITAAYVISGIVIGTLCGIALGRMKIENLIEKEFRGNNCIGKSQKFKTIWSRVEFGISEAIEITKRLWLWILAGVGIGAIIHNFIPQAAIESAINATGIFAVPMAVLIGAPIYASCVAIVPIAIELFQKGVPLGTALSFMVAVSALSLPEAVMLKRVMKTKLIAIFFGIVILGIILTGYLFNFLQNILI